MRTHVFKFDEFLQLIYLYNRHQLYANNNNSLRLNGFQCRFVTICRLINFNSFYVTNEEIKFCLTRPSVFETSLLYLCNMLNMLFKQKQIMFL